MANPRFFSFRSHRGPCGRSADGSLIGSGSLLYKVVYPPQTGGQAQAEGGRYFAAGRTFGMYAGDVDGDGDVDTNDTTQIQTWITGGAFDARGDLDRNGLVNATDKTIATANIGVNLGVGVGSAPAVFNRKAYAGYERDAITTYETYHVRHRVLNAEQNRWMTRDPIGYVDGVNLYGYVRENPVLLDDPSGFMDAIPGSGGLP